MRVCGCGCGRSLDGRPGKTRYFEAKCRKDAFRGRAELPPPTADDLSVSALFRRDLVASGRLETPKGALAMAAARRIDLSTSLMGYSTLLKQARELLDAALEGAQAVNDPVDELQARRDRTRAG